MKEEKICEIVKKTETPIYVYDIEKLKKRIEYIKNSLPKNISLCYAIKANSFIIKEINDNIDRFEVCSPGEYQICKETNVTMEKLVISGVNKTPESIEEMITNTPEIGHYTAESQEQFKLLDCLSKKYNKKINVLLRLTSGNQFGMNEEDIENIVKNREKYSNIFIAGIQYFSGTQKHSLKRLQKEIDKIDDFVVYLYKEYGFTTNEVEFGTGFPVYYFQHEEFDEKLFFEDFSNILNNMKFKGQIILEVGRSIVADCGYYMTKVVDIKTNKGQNYAIIDGGIHQLVYYGQTMAMKHPYYKIYPKREGKEEEWNICGSLCTINDIIVKQLPIADLKIGDVLIFENTGAYSVTEGISLFLSRDLPQVAILKQDGTLEIIRDRFETFNLNKPCYK